MHYVQEDLSTDAIEVFFKFLKNVGCQIRLQIHSKLT